MCRVCVGVCRVCVGSTSMGKALKLTVCSDPRWFSFPQWKRTSCSSYSWSLGRGPPVTTGNQAQGHCGSTDRDRSDHMTTQMLPLVRNSLWPQLHIAPPSVYFKDKAISQSEPSESRTMRTTLTASLIAKQTKEISTLAFRVFRNNRFL